MDNSAVLRKFNVTVVGQGEPTVVLAHGFGSDQTAWRHQIAALAPRHRVVAFDHLGCGKADHSDYDPRRYSSLERYAEDLLAIYDALGLAGTVYVGHSVAAMIGLLASIARPAAFSRLVLVGASPRYLDDDGYVGGFTQADLNGLYSVMADDYLGWANGFAPLVMSNPERPGLAREFARGLAAMRPDIAQSAARVIFESDLRARLREVRHPVLLLQSQGDIVVPPAVADFLVAHIPGCRLRVLSAQGHVPQLSAPEQVTEALCSFLNG